LDKALYDDGGFEKAAN